MSRTQGRRLESYNEDGGLGVEYKYNSDGIRTQKTIDGDTHYYTLDGSKILSEEWSDGSVIHLMIYVYDASGSPIGFRYRKSTESAGVFHEYLYGKNIQGDIIYIFGKDGTKYASYVYDAWGNQTVTYYNSGNNNNVAPGVRYNPFTYRGYYYDEETGFYYLQSRYYDPEIGRFISLDSYINIGRILELNMFAYCENNPVNMIDYPGNKAYFLYDNNRYGDNLYHELLFGVSLDYSIFGTGNEKSNFSNRKEYGQQKEMNNYILQGEVAAFAYKGGWQWEYLQLNFFDVGKAEVKAQVGKDGISAGAIASLYSPNIVVDFKMATIQIGADIGAVGAKGFLNWSEISGGFEIAYGLGFSISFDLNLDYLIEILQN